MVRIRTSHVAKLLVVATVGGLGGCAAGPDQQVGVSHLLEALGLLLAGALFFLVFSGTLAGLFRWGRRRWFRQARRSRRRETTR